MSDSPLVPIIKFLREVDELKTAEALLDVFAKYANGIEQFDEIAKHYMDIKRYKKAITLCEKALAIADPRQAYSVRVNLAKLNNNINYPEKSLQLLAINERLNPKDLDVKLEKMFSLFLCNRKEESKELLLRIMNDPTVNEKQLQTCKFNMGTYDLYDGKFMDGLKGFLVEGKKLGIWKDKEIVNLPKWEGQIDGSEIVIIGQGGIGDEVINVRFVKHLQRLGMKPIWLTHFKHLKTVFDRNGYPTITSYKDVPKTCKYQTYAMTLPIFLNLTEDEVWEGPYLTPDPKYIEKYEYLNDTTNVKVGLKWAGNPEYDQDLHRAMNLEEILLAIPENTKKYSLQKDETDEELPWYIGDLGPNLETFEDTLAIMHHLDYIVTSCTSVAHLAGAMGVKTFVVVPITAYYVWSSNGESTESYWYGDNMTVLRQTKTRSWAEPLQQLKEIIS